MRHIDGTAGRNAPTTLFAHGGTVEIELTNNEPATLIFKPKRVEVTEGANGKQHLRCVNSEIKKLNGDVRSVFEKAAPAEFPRLSQYAGLNGRMWAVRMRPRNKSTGDKMLTYQSSGGTVFNASKDEIPTELKLFSNEAEIKELREMGSQFEVIEVAIRDDEVEGQVSALLSEIELLHGALSGEDTEVEAFTELQVKTDLFCKVLNMKIDSVKKRMEQAGERLIAAHQEKGKRMARKNG